MLRRVAAAGYSEQQAISLEQLVASAENGMSALDELLLPAEDALPDWPSVGLSDYMVASIRQGRAVKVEQTFERANVRLFDPLQKFIGLAEMSDDGMVQPKRVFVVPDIQ